MAIPINQLYPEEYIIEEDQKEMGQSNPHKNLVDYLQAVLRWFYRLERWLAIAEMNVYHRAIRNSEHYIVPDVALVKIALPPDEEEALRSWNADRMPPQVIFEVCSEGTWPNDVRERDRDKPAIYGRIGVKEYFAYDPHEPQVWPRSQGVRLRGWRYDVQGQPAEIKPDKQGRLWSRELQSYLVPDGRYLRLTDKAGNRRLTEAEYKEVELQAEAKAHQAEAKARQAEAEARQQEAQARQIAEQRADEAERQLAELKRQLEELRRQQS